LLVLGAEIVIVDVYVDAVRPAIFTLTVITLVCPAVIAPEVGFRLNHVAGSLVVQLKVPPPVLVMLTVWVAGVALPAAAVNVRLAVLRLVVGGGGGGWLLGGAGWLLGGGG
jgi:hypothetical protein